VRGAHLTCSTRANKKNVISIRFFLKIGLAISIAVGVVGCLESSFSLAPESRLPKWFEVPQGMSRSDLSVTLDYYSTFKESEAVFTLRRKGRILNLKKVTAALGNETPKGYPAYVVVTVNGISDVIEYRKMEPIFYLTDDAKIWKELRVKKAD
jgi:hypothetical protein